MSNFSALRYLGVSIALLCGVLSAGTAMAVPVPVATYLFDGDLSAEEAGAPDLVAIDPSARIISVLKPFSVARKLYIALMETPSPSTSRQALYSMPTICSTPMTTTR